MIFTVAQQKHVQLGTTKDAVLAVHCQSKQLRSKDAVQEEQKVDLEAGTQQGFLVSIADDSEWISIFDSEKPGQPVSQCQIKKAENASENLRQKDLFGLGYPYFICSYAGTVAVSTDYGICVLEV